MSAKKYFEVGYLDSPALFGTFDTQVEADARQNEVLMIASENVFIHAITPDSIEIESWRKPQTPTE